MRYVENGVREDFARLTFKGLRLPLCELDEEEWLAVVFGVKSSKSARISSQDDSLCNSESIDILNLSSRAENCLRRAGITTIGELCAMGEEELSRLRSMGKKSVDEVKEKLSQIGQKLN